MNQFTSFCSKSGILLLLIVFSLSGGCDSKSDVNTSPYDETLSDQLGPNPLRFPHLSIRTEKYLLPAVSTGPLDPVWSPDGRSLYFVSDRDQGLSIFKVELADGDETPVAVEKGNQIQPAISPDGKSRAYVAPVEGKPGSGSIWVMRLPSGEPTLVHYEETRYRTASAWTPDGQSIMYIFEITGNNDIGIIPATGGVPVWLTHDDMNEYSPSVAPDGNQILFVSNRAGLTRMYSMPAGGGPAEAWEAISVTSLKAKQPLGNIYLEIVDSDGELMPARVYLKAADGRSYAPENGFHRIVLSGERHYFHSEGTDTITVPPGPVSIESVKGFEYYPARLSVTVTPDSVTEATLRLERLVNPSDRGWYSGETHAHDLHGGHYGLNHVDYFKQLQAEDLHVTNALIHMDGTRLMGRLQDLAGEPHPLSTKTHILQYGEEFCGSRGHVGLLGIKEFVMPLVGGESGTAYSVEVLNAKLIFNEYHLIRNSRFEFLI